MAGLQVQWAQGSRIIFNARNESDRTDEEEKLSLRGSRFEFDSNGQIGRKKVARTGS